MSLVCSGSETKGIMITITLAAAQRAIMTDWVTAEQVLGLK